VSISLLGYKPRHGIYLFADLRGFTKWVDSSENELQQLLEIYYSCADEVFGSKKQRSLVKRVVKFLGDGFFAVSEYNFKDGKKALEAAFAGMLKNVLSFRKRFRLQMRNATFHRSPSILSGFGMSFGPSVRFNLEGHSMDYSGSQVNIAARLCSEARADELVIERGFFEFLHPILKGYVIQHPYSLARIKPKGLDEIEVIRIPLRNLRPRAKR
jgi:class 3 adenylate cyclase